MIFYAATHRETPRRALLLSYKILRNDKKHDKRTNGFFDVSDQKS
jgi:hypothetical protein